MRRSMVTLKSIQRWAKCHMWRILTKKLKSSTVTHGGQNGAYYVSSATRTDGDVITVEERKEADTSTGKATHMISHGIGNKALGNPDKWHALFL
ncbi:hypothetical protein GUJ93_ZPchr0008g12826 [Zizania palustris]|uniref:Uncharacterized protein n=1 Tax=Zizania palustris TaxID=103762 RepID=A0A8J5RBD6_ZIZPA|nr:hypothetical protein GUJ93_ZPchr0008g12826 [Zizania palustris]KAG8046363.1 hypothetical protein GUJ93_ZPchr0008g12826 [Zizania palustris]